MDFVGAIKNRSWSHVDGSADLELQWRASQCVGHIYRWYLLVPTFVQTTRAYIPVYSCTAVYLFCHRPHRVLRVSGANASDANRHAVDGEVASQYDSVQEAVGVHVLSSDEIEKHFFLRARRT